MMWRVAVLWAFAAACLSIGAAQEPGNLERALAFYRTRPRVERPQAGWQRLPDGLRDLRAATCGECHSAIYDEWLVSTHGQAWTDRQLQSEMAKSGNRWLCNNCHTPLLNQMEVWAVELSDGDVEKPLYVENPVFDSAFRDEGITCAACHVRDGAVEGPTGIQTKAHATRKTERFTEEVICLTCHQAVRNYPGKDFICIFETGAEWRESPYGQAGQPCQSCHMQPVTRPQAIGEAPRSGRRHYWPGAGIFKVEGLGPPVDQLGAGLGVEVEATSDELVVRLSNSAAGHLLPTGDPERFILVEVDFSDSQKRAVGETYRERIGQTWEWWPVPRKLADDRLAPLEVRELRIPRPETAAAWTLVATSHRISAEALEFHDLADYPSSRVTHERMGDFPTDRR
ncbi:MAG: hypothetical protein IH936_12060 [Acidobacteria bacterium]|nr:hypothetical protein [Acidobacteriota bacterium]